MWARTLLSSSKNPRLNEASLSVKEIGSFISRRFSKSVESDDGNTLSRDFLAKLWVIDMECVKAREKRKRHTKHMKRYYSDAASKMPHFSQYATDTVKAKSAAEARVEPLLARSNLLITRDIEWANLTFGFEQENKYAILDACYPEAPVGYIHEQSNLIARQLLRLRRPFVAYVNDGQGNELFRIRRPFWWINSSIYAEIDGEEIGVVHRRWHLWRRIYDLYLGNEQFAVVENPGLWNWTFTLKDIDGNVLAEIDRNWRGFGFEMLTDAGQYAVRFGTAELSQTGSTVIEELEVARPLTLSERAVTLALAVSLDNDYFSRHGGRGLPFISTED